jgi:hypothetical protein
VAFDAHYAAAGAGPYEGWYASLSEASLVRIAAQAQLVPAGAGLGGFSDVGALRAALSTHPATQRFRFLEVGRNHCLGRLFGAPTRPQLHVTYLLKEARAAGLKPTSAAGEKAVLFMLRAGLGRGTSQDDRESVVRRGVVHFM